MSKSSSRSDKENYLELNTEEVNTSELNSEGLNAASEEVAKLPPTQAAYIEEVTIPEKLKAYKDTIYSIAILLTGSIEDAEDVVDEVFEKITYNLTEISHDDIEASIHKFTYDASLFKLLHQVEDRAADLENTGAEILKLPTYLC